jgi:mRNA interferase MazF
VVVVAVTSNTRLALAPGNVLLPKKRTGLPEVSVANVSQLLTVDKSMLDARISRLPPELLEDVEKGLRLVLKLCAG